MPKGIIPDWFFFSVWSPPGPTKSNRAVYADLKGTRSLLVPMNFVSMRGSALDNKETFTMKKMTPEHWQLFGECIDHDLKVVPELISIYKTGSGGAIKSLLLRAGAKYITTERTEVSKWLNPVIPDLKNFEMDEVKR